MIKKRNGINQKTLQIFIMMVCIMITLAAFSPVINHEFINYDDNIYIYDNPHIQSGLTWKSVKWAFSADLLYESPNADFWIPLTFLSHILTIELFGMEPSGHHLMNLLLHVLNVVILFWVLQRMTGGLWASAFVAALFGLHPLHVEPVSWVTERKDVLSTLFWFLTMWGYLRYVERPTRIRYLLVALGLVLGLMAKPMLITLPFVLLLLDYWPLRRRGFENLRGIRKLVWEKFPFFVLVGLSIVVTFLALGEGGHIQSIEDLPVGDRIENALVSYVAYIGKMLLPSGLAVLYPQSESIFPMWKVLGAGVLLVGVTVFVVWRKKQAPYLVVGWLWYVGTLVPTLGIIQAGLQSMADRYTYVPLIGLFIMIAWGIPSLTKKWQYQRILMGGMGGVVVLILGISSWFQVQHWRNSMTLFEHTIKVTERNYLAHYNLGFAYQDQGRFADAIIHYLRSIAINPYYVNPYLRLGNYYEEKEDYKEAHKWFNEALRINPNYFPAQINLGRLYGKYGELDLGIEALEKALKINPNSSMAHYVLGNFFIKKEEMDPARKELQAAIKIEPEFFEAYYNLGMIYLNEGNLNPSYLDLGLEIFRKAADLKPENDRVYQNIGISLILMGEYLEAEKELVHALEINPGLWRAHRFLGFLYLEQLGKPQKAVYHLEQVKLLNPVPDQVLEEALEKLGPQNG